MKFVLFSFFWLLLDDKDLEAAFVLQNRVLNKTDDTRHSQDKT